MRRRFARHSLHNWAIELLNESGNSFPLPDDAVVFLMHQGYQFFYFHADGVTEDPPAYYHFENRSEVERPYERFSDWVAAIAGSTTNVVREIKLRYPFRQQLRQHLIQAY